MADGHYRYSAASDQTPVWVTGQALVATAREPFPLGTVPRAKQPGGLAAPVATPAGGGGSGGSATGSGGSGGGGGRGKGSDSGTGSGAKGGGGGGEAATAEAEAVSEEFAEPLAAEAEEPGTSAYEAAADEKGLGTGTLVIAGLAVLAIGLTAGFFIYRRRLP